MIRVVSFYPDLAGFEGDELLGVRREGLDGVALETDDSLDGQTFCVRGWGPDRDKKQ